MDTNFGLSRALVCVAIMIATIVMIYSCEYYRQMILAGCGIATLFGFAAASRWNPAIKIFSEWDLSQTVICGIIIAVTVLSIFVCKTNTQVFILVVGDIVLVGFTMVSKWSNIVE